MACGNHKVVCLVCLDTGRASLAREIYQVLKSRGFWTPKISDFHNKMETCDLIGAVAMALDKNKNEQSSAAV